MSSTTRQLLWARRAWAVFYFLTAALSLESMSCLSCLLLLDSCSEQGEQELSSTSWPLLLARRVRWAGAVYDLYNRRCPLLSWLLFLLYHAEQEMSSVYLLYIRRCLLLGSQRAGGVVYCLQHFSGSFRALIAGRSSSYHLDSTVFFSVELLKLCVVMATAIGAASLQAEWNIECGLYKCLNQEMYRPRLYLENKDDIWQK